MNNLYFACMDCRVYVDAGYGWASWSLEETGAVRRGEPVSVDLVLSAEEYWDPSESESADWLNKEVLPAVKVFLHEHEAHRIVYGNTAEFLPSDSEGFFDWMQVGFEPLLLPRYFVEELGLKSWEQVRGFIGKQTAAPWWWMLEWEGLHEKARRKFQELIERRNFSRQIRRTHVCQAQK